MKILMEAKQGAINFDIENSIAPLLGFRKIVYEQGKYISQLILRVLVLLTLIVM